MLSISSHGASCTLVPGMQLMPSSACACFEACETYWGWLALKSLQTMEVRLLTELLPIACNGYWCLNILLIWHSSLYSGQATCSQLTHSHWAWLQKLACVAKKHAYNGMARAIWSFRYVPEAVTGIWTTWPNGVYGLSPQTCSAATLHGCFRCSSSSCIGREYQAVGVLWTSNCDSGFQSYHVIFDCILSCKTIWSACVGITFLTVQSKQAPSLLWYQDYKASMHAMYSRMT